jgi:hypothetical protein
MFTYGDGSKNNPYQVFNADQFNYIRNNLSASYILMQDINLSQFAENQIFENAPPAAPGVSEAYSAEVIATGWIPIGSSDSPFTGELLGNGKKIQALFFDRKGLAFNGLFGHASKATFQDVTIENCNISGSYKTNPLAGAAISCSISNVTFSGTVVEQ